MPAHLTVEISVRVLLGIALAITEHMHPRQRDIHPEEWWLYKNHPSASYFPGWAMWLLILAAMPACLLAITAYWPAPAGGRWPGVLTCQLAYWLAILVNGNVTNTVKLMVGRPRPDFYYRCYPEGHDGDAKVGAALGHDAQCYGDPDSLVEGRKSFPSGHSSFSFACLGFLALYLCGRLGVWRRPTLGSAWQPLLCGAPLYCALCIALSRMVDFHHHWEDVTVGSAVGLSMAFFAYRLYYPSLSEAVPGGSAENELALQSKLQQQQKQQYLQSLMSGAGGGSHGFEVRVQ